MKFSVRGLLIVATGLVIGCTNPPRQTNTPPPLVVTPISNDQTAEVVTDPFREGVNKAMAAAELAQTANSVDNWEQVEKLWEDAVMSMGAVPTLSEHYGTAQMKVMEYQKNREYAQEQIVQARTNDE